MRSAAQLWLSAQCEAIPGTTRGVIVLGAPGAPATPAGTWPQGESPCAELVATARVACAQGRVVTRESAGPAQERCQLAVPLRAAPGLAGAVALELSPDTPQGPHPLAERLRLAGPWLAALARAEEGRDELAAVLGLVGVALEQESFGATATVLATELAARQGFERVAIGCLRKGRIRIMALSHSAHFDRRSRLVSELAAAMEEACDQDATLVVPAPPEARPLITRAHEQLIARPGDGAVCTVPLTRAGRITGAFTCQRPRGEALDRGTLRLCQQTAGLLGPILELGRAAEASPLQRLRELARDQLAHLFGPGHPTLKLASALVAGLLLFLGLAQGEYRITARAALEGRVQRAIVAGIDGYVAEASARAGDVVRKGQEIGRLDERDLALEASGLAAGREQLRTEYREALALQDRTELNVLKARVAQADAQLGLVHSQLARARLVAPFDGVIVSGDLSQSLGAPVKKGDILFELAPLEGYRIILGIDERDIADLRVGAPGQLALASMPGETFALTLERITPVATAEDGRNRFRAEARLVRPVAALRPGMEGVARVEVGPRRLLWIWTHDLVDWLRLQAWSWWP